jgi:hypothetical protein
MPACGAPDEDSLAGLQAGPVAQHPQRGAPSAGQRGGGGFACGSR